MAADERRRQWRVVGVLGGVIVLVLGVMGVLALLPNLNPFRTEDVDRSQPVLLQSIKDLAQFHAAVGEFQVVIDLEKDVNWVPSFLAGERALFVAAGTVNAYVDFSQLKDDAISVAPDTKTVEIHLPKAQLDKPNLDQTRSYLFAQQRGIWNRLTSMFDTPDQSRFYQAGEQKIAEAARGAGLLERADKNTRTMLVGMLQPLGFQVNFAADTT
ncbi:MAG TPA: DUF4230 domain-containing protein [Actinophytocola sp.]|uniref:DUF4230 domain-containing protein n=1 Tax=Actinophytocola sp. TaxID=1872138 RepID=UPI002DBAA425|nr:DUF4230 domain-containing protein [Actinophytocola sp.]HEU5472286.1 DUF4230 domain-containing protein [Actinophytocola sp.]